MTEHHRKLERMYVAAPINRLIYEPTIAITEGEATVVMSVTDRLFHAASAMHGSAVFKMLDDACFFAVASLVDDVFVLTTSFTTYFTRPVSSGRVTSRGKVVHRGKTVLLAEAELVDEAGKSIGRGGGAFMKSTIALGPELGYR
jgi:uncharacterized protein (TIGR00369 family)